MNEHLDLDALADVLAGQPSAHLDVCAQCRAEVDALRDAMGPVATALAALAALPDPQPPAGLEERLAAAIAKERHEPSGNPKGAASTTAARAAASAITVTPLASRRDAQRWLHVGAGVAAAAVLVLGGGLLLNRGGGATHSTSSLSGSAPPSYRTSGTGADYGKDGKLLTRELPVLLNGAAKPLAGLGAAPSGRSTAPGTETKSNSPARQSLRVDALARLKTAKGLASCLSSLGEANDPGLPLALDYASFEGQPALVVVLPATKPKKVDVFVVGAACSQADAKVLFFTRLAKPS